MRLVNIIIWFIEIDLIQPMSFLFLKATQWPIISDPYHKEAKSLNIPVIDRYFQVYIHGVLHLCGSHMNMIMMKQL